MAGLVIDGKDVELVEGDTILAAAIRAAIEIPTLCHDPRVSAAGSCRLCLVEVEGRGGWVPACATRAVAGSRVRTTGEDLFAYRRSLLELVLSTVGDEPCHRCAEGTGCELHEQAARHSARAGLHRVATARAARDQPEVDPFIVRDRAQCILCYRCTRVCNELEGAHAIVPAARGFASRIATAFDRRLGPGSSPCTFCGQCVGTCPTGALTFRNRAPLPEGARLTTVRTLCPFCGTGCGLRVDVADGRIAGVRGDPASPVSHGSLCVKGQFGWQFTQSPDRLQSPLVRRDGELRPATWDEALSEVAAGIDRIRADHGPDAIVFFSSARATNESNYLFQKLARAVVGTNNVDNCART